MNSLKHLFSSSKMIKFYLFGLTLLIHGIVSAQEKRTISGYITDGQTGEKLIGALVVDTVSKKGATTNEYGFFSLTIPAKRADLYISYYELKPQYVVCELGTDVINIALDVLNEIEEVTVIGAKREIENSGNGTIRLQMDKVDKLPLILGEKDVMRMIQLLPGVKSGGEASSGIYVRGGGPDQNLILLDGVPIYNASHLFGFFSVFNSDAISNVELIKGGFPARYGGRVSSVLNMRMKEGNLKHYNVEGSIGIISSRILVEGPIKKNKTSFMFSARRTYLDVLIKPFIKNNSTNGGYFFEDFNAKIQHKINEKHHLFLSGYFGLDKVSIKSNQAAYYDDNGNRYQDDKEYRLSWGNAIGAIRWNYKISSKLFLNTTGNYSKYNFFVGQEQKSTIVNAFGDEKKTVYANGFTSGIQDWSLKSDLTYVPNPNHTIRAGISDIYHTFTPGISSLKAIDDETNIDQQIGASRQYSHEVDAYIEDDFSIGNRLKANLGIHQSLFIIRSKTYQNFQPRANFNFLITEKSSVKVGLSRSAQYLHLLSNVGTGLPTDLWVPVTEKTKPVVSNQASVGYYQQLTKTIVFSIEGYYKTMSNLIQYKEGIDFSEGDPNWENNITYGKGKAYGAELFLEKKSGNFSGWIGYTLSWAIRQFDELNDGKPFYHRYDRRHDLSVVASYDITAKWDIGMVFVFGTGNAVTIGTQGYNSVDVQQANFNFGSNKLINYDQLNGYRMPAYHRLDIGANRKTERKYGLSTLSFSIYNVYNRQNPFFIYKGVNKSGNPALMGVSLFPIIPSISWNFKFDFEKIKQIKLNSIKE